MMQLLGALVLLTTLSTACGLRCYTCTATEPKSCTDTKSCVDTFNRCFSLGLDGIGVTKGCINDKLCVAGKVCCEGDLCNSAALTGNSAALTGPSVILLLMSSAIITPFL